MKNILTIVGARPQFIKAAPVSIELRKYFKETLLHTGQHYDYELSKIFFDQLDIPKPDINLNVGSASHGVQTANMIVGIEEVAIKSNPDLILIYGDTNSTLSASIAASKLNIPVAHIEAGLRNFDKTIPEEVNRIVADSLSTYLFAPTLAAINNLNNEGIEKGVYHTGDVMYDSLLANVKISQKRSNVLLKYKVTPENYYLATIHRAENADDSKKLFNIIEALGGLNRKVVFPIHPRTQKIINSIDMDYNSDNIIFTKPEGYLDFLELERNALKIITDSGGVQKEAYCLKVPCITVFPSSSWIETVEDGWNTLVSTDPHEIINAVHESPVPIRYSKHYGNGQASREIVKILDNNLN